MEVKENVILVGNGFNRIGNKSISWNDLLQEISGGSYPKALNTLEYEFARLRHLDKSVKEGKDLMKSAYSNKEKISRWSKKIMPNDLHQRLVNLPVNEFLTTNYDHALEKAIDGMGYHFDKKKSCHDEDRYNMRRYNCLVNDDKCKRIWHIHGDMQHHKSILLGFNHYCGTIGKIDRLYKGGYLSENQKGKPYRVPIKIEEGLRDVLADGNQLDAFTRFWLPYFFTTNIHIIGFGMDESEMDIWWILDKRKRFMLEHRDKKLNHIYFYGQPNDDKLRLLEQFGVEVVYEPRTKDELLSGQWGKYYDRLISLLEKNL